MKKNIAILEGGFASNIDNETLENEVWMKNISLRQTITHSKEVIFVMKAQR